MSSLPVVLRPATAADAPDVADVYLASRRAFLPFAPLAHPEPAVRAWIADVLIARRSLTVAVTDSKIVGLLALSRSGGVGWIEQLYLHPTAVAHGIGGKMVEHAKQILGVPIRLYCFRDNVAARRFYERHGFRAIAFTDGSANEERCPDVLYEFVDPSPGSWHSSVEFASKTGPVSEGMSPNR